jgi:signal transduction histidine kinase
VPAFQKLLDRARRLDPRRVDLGVAIVLVLAAPATLATSGRAGIAADLCGALAGATVAFRRAAPAASVAVAATAIALLGVASPDASATIPGFAAALDLYVLGRTSAARGAPIRDLALLALGALAVACTAQATALAFTGTWGVFVLAPFLTARVLEQRSQLTRELAANAERARREQEARARSAAAEERTRIARELHDVIAHSVSVMVIQTAAAREVAAVDRAAARGALAAVQRSGREALLELRRMIGVLRRGDVELAGAAAPGLGQLDLLAQRARAAGLPVELTVNGARRPLPESVDLVAFRIVQEALTNAIKHAGPAHASVTVSFGAQSLELEVSDDGRGPETSSNGMGNPPPGQGLVGMRERLALFGGELATGPRPGGGFRVHARLPVEETQAA